MVRRVEFSLLDWYGSLRALAVRRVEFTYRMLHLISVTSLLTSLMRIVAYDLHSVNFKWIVIPSNRLKGAINNIKEAMCVNGSFDSQCVHLIVA